MPDPSGLTAELRIEHQGDQQAIIRLAASSASYRVDHEHIVPPWQDLEHVIPAVVLSDAHDDELDLIFRRDLRMFLPVMIVHGLVFHFSINFLGVDAFNVKLHLSHPP